MFSLNKNMMTDIEWVKGETLQPGPWRSSYLLKPDLEVLARSMAEYGWLQPIIVQTSTMNIIDGNVRWEIAGSSRAVKKTVKSHVPVIFQDVSDLDAAFMHIRLNRSKGHSAARQVSKVMRDLIMAGKLSQDELRKKMAMTSDEIDVMLDGTLLKHRKIDQHKYSRAWVPVEAPSASETTEFIERPPNEDR